MKKLTKILALLLIVGIMTTLCLPLVGCNEEGGETLVVYNWEEYIDESVLEIFEEYYEEKTGKAISVVYSKYDTNETMLTKIMNGDASIDVMCPSEYAIEKLLKAGKILKIDKSYEQYPYMDNVDKRIYSKVNGIFGEIEIGDEKVSINDYYVPYMWGTLGILYNADVITESEAKKAGWGLLWNETKIPELEGNIYMKDSIRDAYVAAVMYAKEKEKLPSGYEEFLPDKLINDTSADMLKVAEEVLAAQRSHLKGYEVDFGKSDLAAGVGYVDLAWSGDAMYAVEELGPEEGRNLAYFVPDIGSNIWFDGWVISKESKNVAAAQEFINFLCRPDIAMLNAMEIGYTSALSAGSIKVSRGTQTDGMAVIEENEYSPEEFFDDDMRYPDINSKKLGVMKDFGDSNKTLVEMWERVKTTDDGMGAIIVILVVLVCIALLGVGFIFFKKGGKKKRRVVKR